MSNPVRATDGAIPGLPAIAARVRRRLLTSVATVHLIGGLATFSSIHQVFSRGILGGATTSVMLFVALETGLGAIAFLWARRKYQRGAAWAIEGRPATDVERRRILEEPWRMSFRPLLLWLVAAALTTVYVITNSRLRLGDAADVAQIIVISGIATCAFSYLAVEQIFRPLFAHALAGTALTDASTLGVRRRLGLAWAVGSGVPLAGIATAPIRDTGTSIVAVAVLGAIGLVAGLIGTVLAANSIAEPLDELRAALSRVTDGDLSATVRVDDGGEVGQLQMGFNRMVLGLRERQRIQDLFGRHVGAQVAERALERGTGLGGEQRRASVIFVDLIGSTAMAEVLPPNEVVATLNAFFQAVVDVVGDEGGWVNKFEGDGALCIFGVPALQPDHERRALRAARQLRTRLVALGEQYPGLEAGIGVSSGVVVAGNVGTEERFEYTVIGRAVNEAARLTDLAKQRPSRVLASAAAVQAGGMESAHWADRGRVGLRGQQAPTVIFEPTDVPLSEPRERPTQRV